MDPQDLVRNVVQAAADFNGRRLWKRFTNLDCFAARVPEQGESMLGVVMGAAGEQFGLSLFRGEKAAACLAAILDPAGAGDDAVERADMLTFSMEPFRDLPLEAQASIRKSGLHPRYDEQVPNFLAKRPGRQPHVPDESDLGLLLMVLRGAVEADKRKLLEPARLDDQAGVCTLHLSGGAAAPQVSVTRERWLSEEPPAEAPVLAEAADLSGLPRLDETWLVGLPPSPARVEGDDRSFQLLLVVDDASEFILQGLPVPAGELGEAIDGLLETFRSGGAGGRKGLPHEIVFSSQALHDAMKPLLERVGVKCIYMPTIPKLQEINAEMQEFLGREPPPFAEPLEAPGAAEDKVPAPDDLAGWKEVDRRIGGRFFKAANTVVRLSSPRAVKRYFGRDDLRDFFEAHQQRGVVMAYSTWAILDYRTTRKSKTYAEEMLAEGLPEAEAMLVRARIEAHPTLYRVASHDPKAGTIDLEDVLLGGTVTVHDQVMSENIEDSLFLAARTFRAGRFHFIEPAGPPLGAGMGMEAAEFLQDCGVEFTRDGLRAGAHVFGWLWDWADEWQENFHPHLCNTDKEDLLWHTASFSVADLAVVRQALLQRKDLDHDEVNDEFVWLKKTGEGAKMLGGPVTLGRIEFVGDELVLTVNSSERFARARKWLEALPGVVFHKVTTRGMDEAEEDRPMDERIAKPEPVEITPGMASALQEMFEKRYMEWLDMPLPVLGGRTPRQTCKTAAGRQQITMMIRTIPDPMGPSPIRVPRQAMLRELGLEHEAGTGPVAAPPMPLPLEGLHAAEDDDWTDGLPIVNRSPKIGRNDPCPCGSGKKYKKCCGRTT